MIDRKRRKSGSAPIFGLGHPGERAGFTLIELLVVITIILIVSAVALPTVLPAMQHRQVSEAARILQAVLVGARDAAIRDNAPSGIRLLPDPQLSGLNPTGYARQPRCRWLTTASSRSSRRRNTRRDSRRSSIPHRGRSRDDIPGTTAALAIRYPTPSVAQRTGLTYPYSTL